MANGPELDETTDVSVKKELDVHVTYTFIQRMTTTKTLNNFERHIYISIYFV